MLPSPSPPTTSLKPLFLESIFALELFRGVLEGFEDLSYSPNDPVFAFSSIKQSLQRDMIMLENQLLSLFVLDWILALQLGYEPSLSYRVAPLTLHFFNPLMPTDELHCPTSSSDPPYEDGSGGALHCLDVFCHSLRLCPTPASISRLTCRGKQSARLVATACWLPIADKWRRQLIHCVANLRDADIKFRRRTGVQFWDIEFKDGVMYISRLLIHDGIKSHFLNLITFEQCHLECGNHITSYLTVMNNLINSEVDANTCMIKKLSSIGSGVMGRWLICLTGFAMRWCSTVMIATCRNYRSR
ncbi:UPF0481 protein [Dendrobium catenatum]|uniref:UPF0481 protein n=1 Tax=Dendrobium catenatum TaxID=906689 RepID=A0A2I0W541_9ASPA|nr:UPF0481 protein [Dendrobium catenatum]